ncbi:putative ABC transport system permease protein [Anoxybacillus pushchinoensis]|uniref:Putative ABC transport system permease protein n=1 Tax=Anoxybacillus pushchinoensis TaxID=150248 RepID=A0A1I0TH90_9BACL|nr:ABC transporter permease [Anoxybacillus pushchinoensis]SFA51120.1 putative ABC transport system permease protein [Anoxybacillus pushchinoensis]
MITALFSSVEAGLLYALMALGVYISFRILDFPDLTVDGSFVTGAAVASVLIVAGVNPFIASLAALGAGFLAGCMTGLLHTKGKINPLLSGILMMIALYSINLRIMDKPNVPLLQQETVMTMVTAQFQRVDAALAMIVPFAPKTWAVIVFGTLLVVIAKVVMDLFLKTEVGLALRAVGDNKKMIASFSGNTDRLTIIGLGLSNALVAFSGALIAQYSGFSDIGMGIGMIVIGLASVIIGEALFGAKTIVRATLAVILGAIVYRIVITLALRVQFLETGDVKLITAFIVILALVVPQMVAARAEKQRKARKRGAAVASTQADYESV